MMNMPLIGFMQQSTLAHVIVKTIDKYRHGGRSLFIWPWGGDKMISSIHLQYKCTQEVKHSVTHSSTHFRGIFVTTGFTKD
eukprot:11587380-Ditylum_brightwellii.AAC.1